MEIIEDENKQPIVKTLSTRKSYYFVYYECKSYGWKPKDMGGTSTGCNIQHCQTMTDIHPLQFQLDCNKKYGSEHETSGGHTSREEYMVLNWIEVSKEEYKKFKGYIG